MNEAKTSTAILPYAIALGAIAVFGLTLAAVLGGRDGGAPGLGEGAAVGLVELRGPILESRATIERLDALAHDDEIKAILLRLDSPGGAVGPSQEIYEAVLRAKERKPVVVSMEAVAASGAFYVAAAGTHVLANPGTLTGSIGVIMAFADFSELLDWAKIRMNVVKTGRFKDTGAGYRPPTSAETAYLQDTVNAVQEQFVRDVVQGRAHAGVSEATVRSVADGRIFTGERALELKLIDQLGGYSTAVSVAAELGGIEGRPEVRKPKPLRPWIQQLLEEGLAEEVGSTTTPGFLPLWAIWVP